MDPSDEDDEVIFKIKFSELRKKKFYYFKK